MYLIGQSTDIHQFCEGRKLILGGVEIPYERGLLGHSDADVLLHAIAESILGALGLQDLGTHFSDRDPKYKNISSIEILESVYKMMKDKGYCIQNLDSLILCEQPKMASHIDKMRDNISLTLHCCKDRVNVKATRGEGLGFIGRKEGIVAQCIVLLKKEDGKNN